VHFAFVCLSVFFSVLLKGRSASTGFWCWLMQCRIKWTSGRGAGLTVTGLTNRWSHYMATGDCRQWAVVGDRYDHHCAGLEYTLTRTQRAWSVCEWRKNHLDPPGTHSTPAHFSPDLCKYHGSPVARLGVRTPGPARCYVPAFYAFE